jgi:hypothetical protein
MVIIHMVIFKLLYIISCSLSNKIKIYEYTGKIQMDPNVELRLCDKHAKSCMHEGFRYEGKYDDF